MHWKRPPIHPLRLIAAAILVITAIIAVFPEFPTPFSDSTPTQPVASSDLHVVAP